MTLRIIPPTQAIEVGNITMGINSGPGLGKTSLGFSASRPLNLNFDVEGMRRVKNRLDSVQINDWREVASMSEADFEPYESIVIDTFGRALDKLSTDIIRREPKLGYGGALTLQGYGRLKAEFSAFVNALRSYRKDIVMLAHMEEQKGPGDSILERIIAQGASKNEFYMLSDCSGRLVLRNGKRQLLFSPEDTAFGKNPADLPPLDVPPMLPGSTFLADVIERIKNRMTEMSAEQVAISGKLASWSERIASATTAGAFTKLIAEADKLDDNVQKTAKRLLWERAKSAGMAYDESKKAFTEV